MTENKDPMDHLKGSDLEFVTIQEDDIEQEKIKRSLAAKKQQKLGSNKPTAEKRSGEVRREGDDRREEIRFEDDRRDGDERRKENQDWG